MELELHLDPDDAARLPRLSCITRSAPGRPRVQKLRQIWHDDAERSLARRALCLAQARDGWRLERLQPGSAVWLPGTPSPVLERAADVAAFAQALPSPLAPVAAFEGRLASYEVSGDEGPATLGLLRGTLRAVADERPVCRVHLGGTEAAVHALALAIAAELRLAVPQASLAAEGQSLAHGAPAPPRHSGAPWLPPGLSIIGAFGFVLGHLTDVILHAAAAVGAPGADPEPVHQMRVAVRRLRSALAVFRPAIASPAVDRLVADLKAFGTRLGPSRDWDVFMNETLRDVLAAVPDDARLSRLAHAAERRRHTAYLTLREFLAGPEFRQLGIDLAWLASAQSWQADLPPEAEDVLQTGLLSFAGSVLHRRHRKLLAAGDHIDDLDPAGLHAVRLRAKRLRYTVEMFAALFPGKAPRRFLRRLSALQERLGELNDVATVGPLLAELGGPAGRHGYAVGLISGFGAARGAERRGHSLRSWQKFCHQSLFWE